RLSVRSRIGEKILQRSADERAPRETRRQVCRGQFVGRGQPRNGLESARDGDGRQDWRTHSSVPRSRQRQVGGPVVVPHAGSAGPRPRARAVAPRRREISPMTLPNQITLARILMIPVFVWLTLGYIRDYQKEQEQEWE